MSTAADGAATAPVVGPSAKPADASAPLELPEDIEFKLDQFKHLLAELQKALQAAAAQVSCPADLAATPDPLERARLCMCVAKAVNSLHHIYIRAHGRDPFAPTTAGGVAVGRQELDRIRQYDKKVARAVQDAELRASRPVLTLDVAAASRFIDAAIPDLTEQQRRDLKRMAQAAEAKRGGADRRKAPKLRQREGPGAGKAKAKLATAPQVAKEHGDEDEESAGNDDDGEDEDGQPTAGSGDDDDAGQQAAEEDTGASAGAASGPAVGAGAVSNGAQAAAERFLATLSGSGVPWGPTG